MLWRIHGMKQAIRPGKLQDICNMGGTGFNNLDEGWCQMVSDGLASYLRKTT
jgi:hypothetical protein